MITSSWRNKQKNWKNWRGNQENDWARIEKILNQENVEINLIKLNRAYITAGENATECPAFYVCLQTVDSRNLTCANCA